MIDLYCERISPGLLGEPLNAVTNLAFLMAAWLMWRRARHDEEAPTEIMLLAGLMLAIGIGSALFNTFATRWAMLLDLAPIVIFQGVFLWSYTGRAIGLSRRRRVIIIVTLLAAITASLPFTAHLNGSLLYLPALLSLIVLAAWHYRNMAQARTSLVWATALLAASLVLRTVDQWLCPVWPAGTHFGWHLLNAVVLYQATSGLLAATRQSARTGGAPVAHAAR